MDSEILDDVFETEIKLIPATKGTRFVNYLIDYFFIVFLLIGLLFGLSSGEDLIDEAGLGINLTTWILFFVYYFGFEVGTQGKSLGKIITKTRVVTEDGRVPSVGQFAGRSAARLIPFEAFSFLGSGHGGWHDSLPKTMVIDEKQSILPSQDSGFIVRN